MKARTRISLVQLGGLVVLAAVLVFAVNQTMRAHAMEEARAKARLILDRNLAIHTYFSHDLKPSLIPVMAEVQGPEAFDPVWMSSTFAIRRIHEYFLELNPVSYYYKESAEGARNPLNEADSLERDFLQNLNANPELTERSTIREFDGVPHFQLLRRGETIGAPCLQCHSTPPEAPAEMVAQYGPDRSFNREEGEVVSAISVRIPLGEAFASADRFTAQLSTVLVSLLIFMWAGNILLWNHWLLRPLTAVRNSALRIANSREHLGEVMEEPEGDEMKGLVQAFNAMSGSLGESHGKLEERVKERTRELEEALHKVRALSGLLPICSRCKKIRDDEGYWNHLESYISTHSDVLFSHGICPDCAQILYPEHSDEKGESP